MTDLISRYKWAIPVLVVLVLAYVVYLFVVDPKGGPEALCALVIDRSGSADAPETRERYERSAEAAVEGCGERRALLTAYYFTEDGGAPNEIGTFELFPESSRNEGKQENEVERAVEEAKEEVLAAFDVDPGTRNLSDILGAVDAASTNQLDQAAGYEGGDNDIPDDQRFLIALSDGRHVTDDIRVPQLATHPEQLDAMVATASELDLVPPLDTIAVTFAGVDSAGTVGSGEGVGAFLRSIHDFWAAVVTDGGGELCVFEPVVNAFPPERCEESGQT
jgi:hypothetical protein